MVKVAERLVKGRFIERPNRFLGIVQMNKKKRIKCHIPNPGRMEKFLKKGTEVLPEHRPSPRRKTQYTMLYVKKDGFLILIDSILSNKIFREALEKQKIPEFRKYKMIEAEKPYGKNRKSRIDFLLDERVYIEIKSVNYQEQEKGYFPDAPSKRAQRHLKELSQIARNAKIDHESPEKKGLNSSQAWVVFLVQRNEIQSVSPFDEIDPTFGQLLRKGLKMGLKTRAYKIRFTEQGKSAFLGKEIPVLI